jgi:hypothetical protein
VPISIIPKSFLKCCLFNAQDGREDDILWDDSEQSRERISSSGNESVTARSLDRLSDILTIWPIYT